MKLQKLRRNRKEKVHDANESKSDAMNIPLLQKHLAAYKKHLQDDRENHAQGF